MRSKPTYQDPDWDPHGRQHVLFAGTGDLTALRRVLDAPPPGTLTLIHLWSGAGSPQEPPPVGVPAAAGYVPAPDEGAALSALQQQLSAARMGARLYLAGSEDLVWQASRLAQRFGLGECEVRRWRCGAVSRPVFCVHCRVTTPGVRSNVVACSGCSRMLFVRDHFSRRLGAYMGFQVDAEDPGQVPQVRPLDS